jgi:hypothetical protein
MGTEKKLEGPRKKSINIHEGGGDEKTNNPERGNLKFVLFFT